MAALLEKQKNDYGQGGYDWREIARERVFPYLQDRMPLMTEAAQGVDCIDPIRSKVHRLVTHDLDVLFVVYVGIGCGAGWGTTLEDRPACLFGLENIAELGYSDERSFSGLVAHELGHVVHTQLQDRHGLEGKPDFVWRMWQEGIAMRHEHIVMEEDSWHGQAAEWVVWCNENKGWLASEFLRRQNDDDARRDFFGSWFSVQGRSGTAYFLGHEVVCEVERELSFGDILLLPWEQARQRTTMILERMAGSR